MSNFKSVDKVVLTFLVDNNLEWFTALPPGFTHELPRHIQHCKKFEESTGVPIMDFNDLCCGAHGLAILIETHLEGQPIQRTLFDTGPDSTSLARNIKALRVNPNDISRVVLSHWHSDHSGGMLSYLKLRSELDPNAKPCAVDLHPNRPDLRGIAPGPTYDKVIGALPPDPTFKEIEDLGGVVEKSDKGHAVAEGTVWVSGEIPRVTEIEAGLLGGMRLEDKKWVAEPHIMDERYAAVDVAGKGLVLFSSCSHAGIINVVKDAVNKFSRPIYMIVGGLHLAPPDCAPRTQPTVDFLAKQLRPSPTYVLPMHCSGFRAKVALQEALGEGCVPASTGHRVEILGDRSHDPKLFPPVY